MDDPTDLTQHPQYKEIDEELDEVAGEHDRLVKQMDVGGGLVAIGTALLTLGILIYQDAYRKIRIMRNA
jgi:hypothetical protein